MIPLFNEEESLQELCHWIGKVMHDHNFTYEVFLVDDGSNDSSWQVVEQLSADTDYIWRIHSCSVLRGSFD